MIWFIASVSLLAVAEDVKEISTIEISFVFIVSFAFIQHTALRHPSIPTVALKVHPHLKLEPIVTSVAVQHTPETETMRLYLPLFHQILELLVCCDYHLTILLDLFNVASLACEYIMQDVPLTVSAFLSKVYIMEVVIGSNLYLLLDSSCSLSLCFLVHLFRMSSKLRVVSSSRPFLTSSSDI